MTDSSTADGHVPLSHVEAVAQKVLAEMVAGNNLERRGVRQQVGTLDSILHETLQRIYDNERGSALLPSAAPFALKSVPALATVADRQLRLTTRIMCAVSTRPFVTVYELESEICSEEGVAAFADLGFGRHLQALPIVQQYFQVSAAKEVMPVTTGQVFAFLLDDRESEHMESLQDSRTFMNRFRSFYERTYLKTGECALAAKRITNNRDLGLHIQSLPVLLSGFRQAISERTTSLQNAVEAANAVLQKNATLYTEVIRALDQRLMASTAEGAFSVKLPEKAARLSTVPLALWESNREGDGGVSLPFTIGQAVRPSASASAGAGETHRTIVPTTSVTPVAVPSFAGRRRRGPGGGGAVIRDEGAVVAVAAMTPAPAEAIPPPSTVLAIPLVSPSAAPSSDCEVAADAPQQLIRTPLEMLHQYAIGGEELSAASLVRTVLSKLAIGQTISTAMLTTVFERLSQGLHDNAAAADTILSEAFVPIPHPTRASREAGCFEIVALARLEEVCWDSCVQDAVALEASEKVQYLQQFLPTVLTGRLSFVPHSTRTLFKAILSRSETQIDFLAPWLLSCQIVKKVTDIRSLEDASAFTSRFLRALFWYAEAIFAAFPSSQAFQHALRAQAERHKVSLLALFPCDREWCCPADGLFFGGPHFFGYRDLRLRPSHRACSQAVSLRVLWGGEGHSSFVADWTLAAFGVASLAEAVLRRVSFASLRHSDTALLLHKAVALLTPFVQSFLVASDPQLYTLSQSILATRLRRFQVVLGKDAVLTESLLPSQLSVFSHSTTLYSCSSSLRLTYLPQHNTLYGEDADCSPSVVAHALTDLYLPLRPLQRNGDTVDTLQRLLERLLRVFFSHVETGVSGVGSTPTFHQGEQTFTQLLLSQEHSPAERQLTLALQAEAKSFARSENLLCDLDARPHALAGPALVVAPVPPLKRQLHFPPGCDGMGLPSRRADHSHAGPRLGSSGPAGAAAGTTGGDQSAAARSLPQWDSEFWQAEAADVLSRALETLRCSKATVAVTDSLRIGDTGAERKDEEDDDDDEEDESAEWTRSGQKRPRPVSLRKHTPAKLTENRVATTVNADGDSFLATRPRVFVSADGTSTADDTTAAAAAAERFVFENVKLRVESQNEDEARRRTGNRYEVVWMNTASESGAAYDLVVLRHRQGANAPDKPAVAEYIEVKSTTSNDRADFELSIRELLQAARYGNAYKIYRVFGASTSPMRKMRFRIYEDILRLWYIGKLTLTGSIHATPSS